MIKLGIRQRREQERSERSVAIFGVKGGQRRKNWRERSKKDEMTKVEKDEDTEKMGEKRKSRKL